MKEFPYHLNLSTVSRRKDQSATKKAAYNSADRIRDLRRQETFDFRYKNPGIVAVKVYLPFGCSTRLNRSEFWNLVEARETRWDARVAREFKGALPHSLSEQGRLTVMDRFSQFVAEKLQTLVMGCMHRPGRGDERNDHLHTQFATRAFDGVSLGKKHRDLDHPKTSASFVNECRGQFAKFINAELTKEGIAEFADHRSYASRQVAKAPGKHLGPKRWWKKKKLEEEIAVHEAAIEQAEAAKPLSEAELEMAIRFIHRFVASPDLPLPPGLFTVDSEGFLKMAPAFSERLEKTKKAEAAAEPKVEKSAYLQEFLSTWLLAQQLADENRKELEKKKRDRRGPQRDYL